MREDHYAVLSVSPDASEQEIKRAYRRLAVQFHPDQRPSRIADMLMRRLNEAYAVLSDADKRRAYDAEREAIAEKRREERRQKKREKSRAKSERERAPQRDLGDGEDQRRVGRVLSRYARERDRAIRRVAAVDDNAESMRQLAVEQESEEALAARDRDRALQLKRVQRAILWLALLAAAVLLLLRMSG